MSAETDFRAALVAHAPLVAAATKIVENTVDEGTNPPWVVFTPAHDPTTSLNGTVLADQVLFTVECWATGALAADNVANLVVAALAASASAQAHSATIISRRSGFDAEQSMDATVLEVEWWA